MNQPFIIRDEFRVAFQGKEYECIQMDKNGRTLYQIKFPGGPLYLTEARASTGEMFWTTLPYDPKLNHLIPVLAKQIDKRK